MILISFVIVVVSFSIILGFIILYDNNCYLQWLAVEVDSFLMSFVFKEFSNFTTLISNLDVKLDPMNFFLFHNQIYISKKYLNAFVVRK